jgi:hypothetical protein
MRPTVPSRAFWRRLTFAPTMVLCAVAGLFAVISFLTACKAAGHR